MFSISSCGAAAVKAPSLLPQLELLKKISDTLGVLGFGELRQRVQDEIPALSQIIQDGKPPSEESLVRVAGVLLSVEDSLDDQLVRLILPQRPLRPPRTFRRSGQRIQTGQRGGAARVHRQSGPHQGSGVDRGAESRTNSRRKDSTTCRSYCAALPRGC